jgi:hypothetical protein
MPATTPKATTALDLIEFADLQLTDEVLANDYAGDGVTVVSTARVKVRDLLRLGLVPLDAPFATVNSANTVSTIGPVLGTTTDGVLVLRTTATAGVNGWALPISAANAGLGNVDDTSDANKPVSIAAQAALDLKANSSTLTAHTGSTSNPHSVTATQVGLGPADSVEFGAFIPPAGTTAEIDAVNAATIGQVMIDTDRNSLVFFNAVDGYKQIGATTASVTVGAFGAPVQNGNYFKAAYTEAKALTPNGSALSFENRAVLILGAGIYDLGGVEYAIDGEFVDIVVAANLGSDPESLITKKMALFANGRFNVTANDIFIYGLTGDGLMRAEIKSSKPLQVWQSCAFAGGPSFGPYASGTFINCLGGASAFGSGLGVSDGMFINCVATGFACFGGDTAAAGTYIKCKSTQTSTGAAFGTGADASGYFEDCTALCDYAFGGYSGPTPGAASGTFVRCVSLGLYGFGGFSAFSGVARNCQGGTNSFGDGAGGTLTGTLLWCETTGVFNTVSGAGKTRMCLNGSLVENNQG